MKPIQTAVTLIALAGAIEFSKTQSVLGHALNPSLAFDRVATSPQPLVAERDNLFEAGMKKQEQEDYAGAIADYTAALETQPRRVEVYSNRGFAYAMLNHLKSALVDFDRAIELAPNNADAYNGRGNVNAMAGNLPASIRDFNQSIRCNRDFADAYYNRAVSRHGLGDRRGAKRDLTQAAKLFQQQQDLGGYQQAREWMNKLK
ncbi:tetratricopeptide repeat protein [Chamaesiphon sp. VAR_69_metabat_338]|uniref:tetratricopeptide repeat protein n=1 Tax=Chamaesiphon sp. VAR_69_metabat_338 TaxID=2964704 RepID=UPI00286E6C41|nr:tetratricopeptide repeat protein [Chamaesiphon sp. VAR_69_metabat_338]